MELMRKRFRKTNPSNYVPHILEQLSRLAKLKVLFMGGKKMVPDIQKGIKPTIHF